MRFWEIVAVGALALFVVWPAFTGQPRRPWGWIPIVAAAAATVVHLNVEGQRWQMYGIYALVVVLIVASAWEILSPSPDDGTPPPGRLIQFGRGLLGLGGITLLIVPAVILPVVVISTPAEAIGTTVLHVVDQARIENYGPDAGQVPRQIALQVWYPTEAVDGKRAPFFDSFDDFGPGVASYLSLPPFTLNHLRTAQMGAFLDAPVVNGSNQFPVIVYSHGWGGFRTVAFTEAEELAAHGYVVVAIDHTYGALGTTIDGGSRFASLDPNALPNLEDVGPEAYEFASTLLVDTFRLDIATALGVVAEIDAGTISAGQLSGRVDLDRVGVYGHSTGGGAAIEFCATDVRCVAVFGLDPWVEPVDESILAAGLEKPMAAIRSEAWLVEPNEQPLARLWAASSQADPLECILGTVHRDFTLLPRISPLAKWLGLGGSLAPDRTSDLVDVRLVSFFDRELKGEGDGTAGSDAIEISACG